MFQDRDNRQWIEALQADGPQRDAALSDLRRVLLVGLKAGLKARPDLVESLLEDVVQEALLRILRSLAQFQHRSRFVTWATAVAIRVALTELRKRKWRDVSLEKLVADSGFEPASVSPANPERQALLEAMDKVIATGLTEKQRAVLLAEIKGMPQVEIARQTGASVNAVYKLSHDARNRLKRGLEQAGFTAQEYANAFR
jgi:RNA polymerase sigma-70 factor (ECF subfamily)